MNKKIFSIIFNVISESDIILFVLDSRFVQETRNFEIEKSILNQNKQLIYILNKSDLLKKTKKPSLPSNYFFISCKTREGINQLRNYIKIIAKKLKKEKVIIGVLGYPNTGKSSVINLILGRKNSAKTSPEAGFTKGIQKLRFTENIYILDTPGIIPEKELKKTKLSKIGVMTYNKIKDPETAVQDLINQHPGILESFYNIESEKNSEILIEKLGRKKNILKKRGEVDSDRVARMILKDWQSGKIKL